MGEELASTVNFGWRVVGDWAVAVAVIVVGDLNDIVEVGEVEELVVDVVVVVFEGE